MDEKTNFASPSPSSPDPLKNEPKITLTGNSLSGSSGDIKPPESPNHLLSPEPNSSLKVDIESAFNQKSTTMSPTSGEKKPNSPLMIIGGIFLIILAAAASGYAVYYYYSTQLTPLQKDKALLQSQVGNMKSQLEVLEKDKKDLQSEVTRLQDEAKALKATETPAAPTADQPQLAPTPAVPSAPATPGTGSVTTP